MDWKGKKRPLMGLVGGVGVIVFLGGALALYSMTWALFGAVAVWILGAVVVNLLAG